MRTPGVVTFLVLCATMRPSSIGTRGDWDRVLEEAARNQPPPLTLKDLLDQADAERQGQTHEASAVVEPSWDVKPLGPFEGVVFQSVPTGLTPHGMDMPEATTTGSEGLEPPGSPPVEQSTECSPQAEIITILSPPATIRETATVFASPATVRETITVSAPTATVHETITVFAPPATLRDTVTVSAPPETVRETITISAPPTTLRERIMITSPPVTVRETLKMTEIQPTRITQFNTQTMTTDRWLTSTVTQTFSVPTEPHTLTKVLYEPSIITEVRSVTVTSPPQLITATATVTATPEPDSLFNPTNMLIRDEADRIHRAIDGWLDDIDPLLYAICGCCCWMVVIATTHLVLVICQLCRQAEPRPPLIRAGAVRAPPIIRRRAEAREQIELRRL